jgi:esterase/lipase
MSGSPDCNIDRTFTYQFYFQTVVNKSPTPKKTYRNPIYLAKEYKKMIDSREVKNQAELARIKSISRARITQILNLLKLDKNIIDNLEQIGDPMDKKVISERELRKIIH